MFFYQILFDGIRSIHKIFFKNILLIALLLIVSAAWGGGKKGVGLSDVYESDRIKLLNVDWYYTWGVHPIPDIPVDKFVPMISGGKGGGRFFKDLDYFINKPKVKYLLTVNEPDRRDQGNKSPEEVVRLWPNFVRVSENVGSPASTNAFNKWWKLFYSRATAEELKIDFMAMHIYGAPDAKKFLKKVDEAYKKYRMPIWITEFAVSDWSSKGKPGTNRYSEEEVLQFMKVVLPELENRSYVIRYAWFGAGNVKNEALRKSRLFEEDGSLTELGQFYAKFRGLEN